jgi:hypothetical protein
MTAVLEAASSIEQLPDRWVVETSVPIFVTSPLVSRNGSGFLLDFVGQFLHADVRAAANRA